MASGCKVCPLRGELCRENCAWYRPDDGRCAVWQIADKLTDVENIALGLNDVHGELEGINKSIYDIWRDSGK